MHMKIGVLTYSKTKEEAKEKADKIVKDMCGENFEPFDYYEYLEGPMPEVQTAEVLEKLITATEDVFYYNIRMVREGIVKYTDSELLNEHSKKSLNPEPLSLSLFRHYLYSAGKYKGSGIYLYDNDGEGIRSRENLDNVLSKWNSPAYDNDEVWLTLYDVHC